LAVGVRLVQLRIKDRAEDSLREEIREAKELCARAAAQLIVSDYWQLAVAEGCDYVHLGQGDLDTADVPALRRAGVRIGISTHSHEELERALALKPDYVALGPVYPTVL
jgi:thiamine-phosphate pyrophosphorylase